MCLASLCSTVASSNEPHWDWVSLQAQRSDAHTINSTTVAEPHFGSEAIPLPPRDYKPDLSTYSIYSIYSTHKWGIQIGVLFIIRDAESTIREVCGGMYIWIQNRKRDLCRCVKLHNKIFGGYFEKYPPMRSCDIISHLEVGQSFSNCAKVVNWSADVATERRAENKVPLPSWEPNASGFTCAGCT